MILITGATGTIGRALVQELRAAGVGARAMTREPAKAAALFGAGVDAVHGDFTDPASLAPALEGVDTLFLLTVPGPSVVEHDLAMLRAGAPPRHPASPPRRRSGGRAPSPGSPPAPRRSAPPVR